MSEPRQAVAHRDELRDGEMKAVTVGDVELVLVRVQGTYYALAGHCTHFGAPLSEGLLNGDRLICPWHHATFNAKSGEQLEPPGCCGLARFEVEVEGDQVMVAVPQSPQAATEPDMAPHRPDADGRTFVVLGGGAAGAQAVEVLRQEGFQGNIVLVSAEQRLPYDRTALSKSFLALEDEEVETVRDIAFYEQHGIKLMLGRFAREVHPALHKIVLDGDDVIEYDALLLATGSVPRRPRLPGSAHQGVMPLRNPEDALRIRDAAQSGSRAAVLGASFIGMECAASLRSRGVDVTVVAPESTPFEYSLGVEVGGMFQAMHEDQGVRFELGTEVELFVGQDRIERVVLKNRTTLDVDLVVLGMGVELATGSLKEVPINRDGSLNVDVFMRVEGGNDGLFAAGDIARFPRTDMEGRARIGHWRVAQQQGRVAARNMVGREEPYRSVPFFWTRQYGSSLQYVGHAPAWDEVIIEGDLASHDFLACYVEQGRIAAVAGMGRSVTLGAVEECMRQGCMPTVSQVRSGGLDWKARLHS